MAAAIAEATAPAAGSEPELIDLTEPHEGVPLVIDTAAGLAHCAAALAAGNGPAAIDAERASGYRYGQRAFLVQIRREGSGTWLIDPEAFDNLAVVNGALAGAEWILHAANQDLPCLRDVGMVPDALFDTELAARLAGLPRVGLGAVIENLLGYHLAKEHSAADWSTRPLPEPWLRYAALDVEVLVDLREELIEILDADGKLDYAYEEFEAIRTAPPAEPRQDPWRRTSGMHQIRDPRRLEAVRELWSERDHLAQTRDVAPGRLIPDSAIVAAAKTMPRTVPQLLATKGFNGRAAKRDAPRWLRCIANAARAEQLPPLHLPSDAPPPQRVWPEKNPEAAARLRTARPRLVELGEQLNIPMENLLTPDFLRRAAWHPPEPLSDAALAGQLRALGARNWQIALTVPVIEPAFRDPDPLPVKTEKTGQEGPALTGSPNPDE